VRALLGPLALLLALGLAGPAQAGQVVVTDRTGDVSQGRVGEEGGYVYQSTLREGDFVRTTFEHRARSVVVTSRFRDLSRVGSYHGYIVRLESGRHVYRDNTVSAGPGLWRGTHEVADRRGRAVRCGVQHSIDYDRNVVRVVVPRACLDRPRFVRGTAAVAWTQPDHQDPSQPDLVQLDNPHSTGADADTWTRWVARG
jgi:hypothetical protein